MAIVTLSEALLQSLSITLSQLQSIPSPFGGLIAVPKSKLPGINDSHPQDPFIATFIAAVNAGATGHDAYWEHGPEERKRLLKILRPHALKLGASTKYWSSWIERQLASLAHNFKDF
jgi:hypothetical protein